MPSSSIRHAALGLAALAALPAAALAQAVPAPQGVQPQVSQSQVSQPQVSQSHLSLAREVMLTSGVARSFDALLPAFGEQLRQANVTRPEIRKDLNEVLTALEPEMELQKQEMINIAARLYASRLSEAELRDIAAFFRSPVGRRYVEFQPQILDDMVQQMQSWTQRVSEYVMIRVRSEMGKRGHPM